MKYIIKIKEYKKFDDLLATKLASAFKCQRTRDELDEELRHKVRTYSDAEQVIEQCHICIEESCKGAFRLSKEKSQYTKDKSVPWWTPELTILRKRVNALRRRYQRTTNNEELRQERRNQYLEGNRTYQATLNKTEMESWKKYCITDGSNPWNAVYKITASKLRRQWSFSTLQKDDGTFTTE